MSEFREFVRAMDIGIAIGKRTAGQVLLGIACGPDLSREQLGEIGRAWSREGQAELDRLDQRQGSGRCRNSTCRADRGWCEIERGSHQLPCCAYCSGVGMESAHADGPAPQAGGS